MALSHPELGRLMVNTCRLHHTKADQAVRKIGLKRGQAFLLMILSKQDGMSHSDIADRLEISAAAVTKVIKRMEEERYLERRSDPTDERVSRVYLLPRGEAVIEEIKKAFYRLDGLMLEGLSEAELDQMRELLIRMQANLSRFQP